MTMKKRTTTILVVLFTLMFAGVAFGQDTATLTLTGSVSQVVQVIVTPVAGYDSLDLTTDQTDTAVATVNELSNSPSGYTLNVESTNAAATDGVPKFTGISAGNTDSLSYTVTYGGVAATFDGTGNALLTDVAGTTTVTGVDKALAISYTGAFLSADTYTDTLTFTIAAK